MSCVVPPELMQAVTDEHERARATLDRIATLIERGLPDPERKDAFTHEMEALIEADKRRNTG